MKNVVQFLISSRRRRTRTLKVRTALSRPFLAGQTDHGRFFQNPDRIPTANKIETNKSGQKSKKNLDRQNLDSRRTPDTIFRIIWTK